MNALFEIAVIYYTNGLFETDELLELVLSGLTN